jgi:DNA-directed RNA polymerase subunit RPC12/RpoP
VPFQTIKTREYECIRCGYKWITRKNGVDKRKLPRFCPYCKSSLWNEDRVYGGLQAILNSKRKRVDYDRTKRLLEGKDIKRPLVQGAV